MKRERTAVKRERTAVEKPKDKASRPSAPRVNILVTGTPGTGKSVTAKAIAEALKMEHLPVSQLAKDLEAYEGWDDERECHILDEDKVLDAMEPKVGAVGGYVVEYHACELFPERWFDLVLVMRASTHILFDRLQERGYNPAKIQENITCEVTDLLLQEARESYAQEIVVDLQNDTPEDLKSNLDRVRQWHANRG